MSIGTLYIHLILFSFLFLNYIFFTLFLSIFVVGKRSMSCMTWGKNNKIQNKGLKERLNFVANQMMGLDL